jgi:undecaprenyl-diphosphatase
MDLLLLLQALILGIVEGVTEFLPISSTGHLIIFGDAMGFTGERAKTFEIFIQLGSILGVMWHYRAKVTDLIVHVHRPAQRRFVVNLLIAFMPAALIGLAAHRYIKAYLFNPVSVACALIVGGILIFVIEHWYQHRHARVQQLDELRPIDALKVGVAQTFALFPGVSRAGATIMGGLLSGLSRTTATEFSFFLAMPTMFAATLYDLYKNAHLLQRDDIVLFTVGFVTAFLTALIVVKTFLVFVSRHTFKPFAWYRIGFGLLVLIYFLPWSLADATALAIDVFLHVDRYLMAFLEQYGAWVYALLFLIVFAETGLVVAPLLPGDSLLFVAGAIAGAGGMEIGILIGLLIVAAILGDTVNYHIGKYLGPAIFRRNSRFLNYSHLEYTHRFYEKHGGKTIVIARFIPIVRTFAPFVAGIGTMPYARFIVYNVAGAVFWVVSFIVAGYFFGNIPQVKRNLSLVIIAIVILSIMPAVVEFLRHRAKNKQR